MDSNTAFVMRLAVIVSLGGFLFGYDAAVISGAIGFVVTEFGLDDWQTGFVVAAPSLSGMIAIGAGPISDLIGRRKILIIIASLYVISAVLSAIAPSYQALYAARFIGGLAFASLALAPIYISEIAPAELRGRLVSINQLNIVVGFSAAYFSNNFFQKVTGSDADWVQTLLIDEHTWRWMLGAEILPALAFFVLLFTVPESPRWLMIKGRIEEARSVISRIVPEHQLQSQIETIKASISAEQETFFSRVSRVFSSKWRYALTIGLVVAVAQQITGINAIYFYAPTIFEQSGVGTDAAFTQAVWIGITNIVFTLLAMLMIDRLGRKPLLVAGLLGVFISMGICSYGFSQAQYGFSEQSVAALSEDIDKAALEGLAGETFRDDVALKTALKERLGDAAFQVHQGELLQAGVSLNSQLILIGILGFVASFAFSLGPVMWVLLPEIYPNSLRGVAMAVVGVCNSGISYGVQVVFPWELSTFGASVTFLVYSLFALFFLVLVMRLLPETKGKSLEQLERELARKTTAAVAA